MTYQIIRSFRAREDLKYIAIYTKKEWGLAQMERYMRELQQTIHTLAESPETKGIDLDSYGPTLRRISHRNHYYIFYQVRGTTVQIVRVLHQRRHWEVLV